MLRWITNYLKDRSIIMKTYETCTKKYNISRGVLQGGVLSLNLQSRVMVGRRRCPRKRHDRNLRGQYLLVV